MVSLFLLLRGRLDGVLRQEARTCQRPSNKILLRATLNVGLVVSHIFSGDCDGVSDDRDEILLGMKKRGFGMGKWNGEGRDSSFEGLREGGNRRHEINSRNCMCFRGVVFPSTVSRGTCIAIEGKMP